MNEFETQLLAVLSRIANELERANDRNDALDELEGVEWEAEDGAEVEKPS